MTRHNDAVITEDTKVKVKMGTAWGVVLSIITTTVWLTAMLLRVEETNRSEHSKLMMGLTELNMRSHVWVTQQQLEDVVVLAAAELHRNDPYWNQIKALELRDKIRRQLRSPKDTP